MALNIERERSKRSQIEGLIYSFVPLVEGGPLRFNHPEGLGGKDLALLET